MSPEEVLNELLTQAKHQTEALSRIANAMENMFARICKEIDEAKGDDGN